MGPSWYWMPEIFKQFFNDFKSSPEEHYTLTRLDPAFSMVFGNDDTVRIPARFEEISALFEKIEPGSAAQLDIFLKEAEFKYREGMEKLAYKPGLSLLEFADISIIKGAIRLQVFSSFSKHIRKYFKDPRLLSLMEFPVLFLGAMPEETPALYSLMNYSALKQGTWYPHGGFGSVVQAMQKIAVDQGARFHFNCNVEKIIYNEDKATGLLVNGKEINCDAVIASADYHHVEKDLLPAPLRNYNEKYWAGRTMSPSCLVFFLGVSKRLPNLRHHTLFFDESLQGHSHDIYKEPRWPRDPLFYVCCPSKTDSTVAPAGHENLFVLMPIAAGLEDTEEQREHYFRILMARLENHIGVPVTRHIHYKKSYCINDFHHDYNSFKGNAYGLANTLAQTAVLKPSIRNKKLSNLFYCGQLTVPGPGVPPAIISGKIAALQIHKLLQYQQHEIQVR